MWLKYSSSLIWAACNTFKWGSSSPGPVSYTHLQDPLSVVLSFTGEEQEDERIDISINEMLERSEERRVGKECRL